MQVTNKTFIKSYLDDTVSTLMDLSQNEESFGILSDFADIITYALKNNKKLLIAGNGGSAADSQHMAGEFMSRLMFDRPSLPAVSLTTDTSAITAIGNDYGYEHIFERQVLGLGQEGDVYLAISTSGVSKNIIRSINAAREMNIVTLGFTGSTMTSMDDLCSKVFHAPSNSTPFIQQIHIVAIHIICALVEKNIYGNNHLQE
jgi:D-sedoheptulose 7-phosphate isomerase